MGIINEPLGVDFSIISRPFTEKERLLVLESMRKDKLKRQRKLDKLKQKKGADAHNTDSK